MSVRQAIVLAAGEGRRLRPVTLHTPKPLVPFFGRPLIDWAVDLLATAGVERFAINAHHLGVQVAAHVTRLRARRPDLDLHVRHEPTLLGTGGAVRNLRDWLEPGAPFFVLNSDAVMDADPRALEAALAAGADAALLVTREPRYAAERRLVAGATSRLLALDEAGRDDAFAFCGLTLADPALPERLPDGPSCILRQGALPYLDGLHVALVEHPGFFADTGSPEALIDAHNRGLAWVSALSAPPLSLTCRGT